MKNNFIVSVDEATKKLMDDINNGIVEVIEEAQETAQQELEGMLSEVQTLQTKELKSLKASVVGKLSKLDEKADAIALLVENQNRNTQLLEEIAEKLNYLSQPFFKRLFQKPQRGNKPTPDINKESE